jgi:hypothetical protein
MMVSAVGRKLKPLANERRSRRGYQRDGRQQNLQPKRRSQSPTRLDGSVIPAKFLPFQIVCCFNRLTLGNTNHKFDALTPSPESTAFDEFGTIWLIQPQAFQKNFKLLYLQGFPPQGIPLKRRFHL